MVTRGEHPLILLEIELPEQAHPVILERVDRARPDDAVRGFGFSVFPILCTQARQEPR